MSSSTLMLDVFLRVFPEALIVCQFLFCFDFVTTVVCLFLKGHIQFTSHSRVLPTL